MRRLAASLLLAALLAWTAGCGAPLARRPVLVYATHTDEDYAGGGTVAEVALALAVALRARGFHDVRWIDRSFLPYSAAYLRSRAALAAHWWRRPALMIDVHRDAAPPGSYAATVDGCPVARVLLVVGRANWWRRRAWRTARRVLAAGDRLYPGLIKGIYLARGEYNQDLGAGALLVEVGNSDSPLLAALRSARLLADVLALAFLGTVGPAPTGAPCAATAIPPTATASGPAPTAVPPSSASHPHPGTRCGVPRRSHGYSGPNACCLSRSSPGS